VIATAIVATNKNSGDQRTKTTIVQSDGIDFRESKTKKEKLKMPETTVRTNATFNNVEGDFFRMLIANKPKIQDPRNIHVQMLPILNRLSKNFFVLNLSMFEVKKE
jgi:hypothetical protein